MCETSLEFTLAKERSVSNQAERRRKTASCDFATLRSEQYERNRQYTVVHELGHDRFTPNVLTRCHAQCEKNIMQYDPDKGRRASALY